MLSLFWTTAVFSNVVHCTIANSIHNWWSTTIIPTNSDIIENLIKSLTFNFGSICLGSLLVAIIKTVRTILFYIFNQLLKSNQTTTSTSSLSSIQLFILKILQFMIKILDYGMEYFNLYAFCFVAIYDYSFINASK